MAEGADVPIIMAFIDYRERAMGFGPVLKPRATWRADMAAISAFYASMEGKLRDQFQIHSSD